MHQGLSRRGFLSRSLGTMAVAGMPAWFGREVLALEQERAADDKKAAANDKLNIGLIGTGDRCKQLIGDLKRHQGWQIVAVCDVDKNHREEVAKIVGGDVTKHNDFRELVARKDIDAVLIVTPDHWHALPAIAAAKAGKDIYCEKPLTLTVAEGKALVKAVRDNKRVLQTGSQQRSDARFRLACELVRNGRIGKIKTIETRIGGNPTSPSLPVASVPEGLDWDFWLGPTPKVDYVAKERSGQKYPYSRCHYEFRWWYEYSGGKMTDWGAHHNDIAQWGMDMDQSGPVAVESKGTAPSKEPNSYNCHPSFEITYAYANGVKLLCMSGGDNGVKFEGEDGKWIFVSRGKIDASDKKLIDEPLPQNAIRLNPSTNHMGNWLECLKSRKDPTCHVEVGHRSVSVCHLGVISLRLGGKALKWDPAKEQFVGDDAANKMLNREMRAPWKLEG